MEIHFNLTSMKICHIEFPFIKLGLNLEADGDLTVHYRVSKNRYYM